MPWQTWKRKSTLTALQYWLTDVLSWRDPDRVAPGHIDHLASNPMTSRPTPKAVAAAARLINALDAVNGLIGASCKFLACALISLITAAVFGGVVMRYVFNAPLEWQEELPKFAMVWMTFLGAVFVYRQRHHIVLDMLPRALPPRLAALLQLLITMVSATVLLVFLTYGLAAAESAKGQRIILLESLSLFWVYLAVPLGSGLLLLAVLQDSLRFAVRIFHPEFEATSG